MIRTKSKRLRAKNCAAAFAAALLFVLVACGGGGGKPTPTPNDVMMIVTPTPGTPVPHTPTPSTGQQTYTVREGDSLSSIASRFGVTEKELQKANNISDPNSIYAGQVLIIPAR
jgi:LysM repeat protein